MIQEKHIIRVFSEELKRRMRDNGIADRELALYCRISEANIPGYRDGDRLPNLWYLVLMAERLDCSVDELLGFKESKYNNTFKTNKASEIFSIKNPFEEYLNKRISQCMTSSHIDIEMLSDYSGVSLWTIKCWLGSNPRLPRTIQFLYICDALGCTPSELLGY